MYSKIGKLKKRILSVVMTFTLAIPAFECVAPKNMAVVSAATVSNPRVNGGYAVWDLVYFGSYPQSDATGATKDPIAWRVLQVNGNDAFLWADGALDVYEYHNEANRKNSKGTLDMADATWDKSCIRSWLNGYDGTYNESNLNYTFSNFYSVAFPTKVEQEALLTANVSATSNPTYASPTTAATSDKVFLLSYEDVINVNYGFSDSFTESLSRRKNYTAYIVGTGGAAGTSSIKKKTVGTGGFWWLRTPGMFTNQALLVGGDGSIYNNNGNFNGTIADYDEGLICPAIHLDLSKTDVWSYAGTVDSNGTYTAGDKPPVIEQNEKPIITGDKASNYVTKESDNGSKEAVYHAPDKVPENVVIPATVSDKSTIYKVTSIASGTFKNNNDIRTIVIGDNVTEIGDEAFSGCANLQTVVIGKNVKKIGAKAFYKCTKLKKIVIPESVNKIGKQAFYGCKNLKSVTIKTTKLTNKNVGSKAFKGTHKKAKFKVPGKKLSAYKKLLKSKGAGSKAKYKK